MKTLKKEKNNVFLFFLISSFLFLLYGIIYQSVQYGAGLVILNLMSFTLAQYFGDFKK